jgi:hypothetical protein
VTCYVVSRKYVGGQIILVLTRARMVRLVQSVP